jgi:hypothetical protein
LPISLSTCITHDQGLEIARKVYEGIADGGFFITTGYTAMILNSKDFSGVGFEVEQMSVPGNVLTFRTPDQLYVLRKHMAKSLVDNSMNQAQMKDQLLYLGQRMRSEVI